MWLFVSACRQGFKPETLSVVFVLPASAHLGGVNPAMVVNPQCISAASPAGRRHPSGLDPKSWYPGVSLLTLTPQVSKLFISQ